jgi:Putative membrane protein insertion efficiency factor
LSIEGVPVDLSKPGGDDELAEEERRRRQEQAGDPGNSTGGGGGDSAGWCDVGSCDMRSCDVPSCDVPSCDVPDCDCGGCNLLRVSTVLALAALVVPTGADGLVAALIRFYRRWLTRLTPVCPSSPSCSVYALTAVQTLGARRGLAAAAHRIRACGGR